MSTEQSLYPKSKSCGCVKFVGGRKRRRTRRKLRKSHKKRKTHHRRKSHKRHRTRHRHKRRRTRHRRRRGGVQILGGGYLKRGGEKFKLAVSDYPPGFTKFINRDRRRAKKYIKGGLVLA
jgi:hypothetical protein